MLPKLTPGPMGPWNRGLALKSPSLYPNSVCDTANNEQQVFCACQKLLLQEPEAGNKRRWFPRLTASRQRGTMKSGQCYRRIVERHRRR